MPEVPEGKEGELFERHLPLFNRASSTYWSRDEEGQGFRSAFTIFLDCFLSFLPKNSEDKIDNLVKDLLPLFKRGTFYLAVISKF